MAAGDTLRLTASATDPDGHAFTYSLAVIVSLSEIRSGYVAFAAINPTTGEFWFYPNSRDVPSRSFQFIAEDELGASASTRFKVTVIVNGAN